MSENNKDSNSNNTNTPTNVSEDVQESRATVGTQTAVVQLPPDQLSIIVEEILARINSTIEAMVVDRLPDLHDRFRMLGITCNGANTGEQASSTAPSNEPAAANTTENNRNVDRNTACTEDTNVTPDAADDAPTGLRAVEARGFSSTTNGGTADQIICPKCRTPVTLPPPELRWYSVWRGRRIGWVQNADRATKLTKGVPGQGIRYHATEEAARLHFIERQHRGQAAVIDIDNGQDINFVVGPWEGVLFP